MNQRSYSKKQEKKKLGTGRGQIDLVIVEDLEETGVPSDTDR
jgi:hypothetical protein